MTITAMVPTLVAIAGALIYLLPVKNASLRQLALYAYACGLPQWGVLGAAQ